MMRFLKLNEKQKENLEKKITDFCYSIKAVNKFFYEDGRKKVGIYIVLDKKEQLNQPSFTKTLSEIMEMSDKTRKFLYMVFQASCDASLGVILADIQLNLDQIYQKWMLNLTYWYSRRVENMQLHGWKELKT